MQKHDAGRVEEPNACEQQPEHGAACFGEALADPTEKQRQDSQRSDAQPHRGVAQVPRAFGGFPQQHREARDVDGDKCRDVPGAGMLVAAQQHRDERERRHREDGYLPSHRLLVGKTGGWPRTVRASFGLRFEDVEEEIRIHDSAS